MRLTYAQLAKFTHRSPGVRLDPVKNHWPKPSVCFVAPHDFCIF